MEQFSSNIYPLIIKNNNIVRFYDQHSYYFKLLRIYTSNRFYKSTHIDIIFHLQYCFSYTVVRVAIFEYKCMHVVFEYKCMHLKTNTNIFGDMPKTIDFHL